MVKLNKILKVSVFALSLGAFGVAPVSQAFADHRDRDRGHHHKKYKHYKKHHNKHNYQYSKHHYKHNRHYKNRRHYNRHYSGHYNYRHHNNHGGEVALGMLTGGLLFYALTANNKPERETVYVKERPVYVQPPEQRWVAQRPAQPQDRSCLQVREYQTTITVGGQSVPAYGQSCLQPDGSWKLGPAIPEPGYN